jgi:hypothetical protein
MNTSHRAVRRRALKLFALLFVSVYATADVPEYTLEIRDHLFYPTRLSIPRNQKVKLIVINRDDTPEEFESYELNREKVIMGGRQAILFIGPLPPGEYPFFGEFHPKTALGTIIVE